MAKGVPIQGKDPLGKAKYANVTAEGDLKVQLSGNVNEIIAQGETTVAAGAVVMVAPNVSVGNYREVYAYAGQAIVGRSWKLELRFRTPWSTSGGWDASVTFEEYTKEGNIRNLSIDVVKCRSEIVSLIIRNNHTEDVTFRWRIGGLR